MPDQLSGLAAITSVLDGTPLETFLPSAFWPAGGIDWDWSSVSFDDVDFAVPFATPGNSYTPLPCIVVSGNGGQYVGSFAETSDGRPAIAVTDTVMGTTQTYMETASGAGQSCAFLHPSGARLGQGSLRICLPQRAAAGPDDARHGVLIPARCHRTRREGLCLAPVSASTPSMRSSTTVPNACHRGQM